MIGGRSSPGHTGGSQYRSFFFPHFHCGACLFMVVFSQERVWGLFHWTAWWPMARLRPSARAGEGSFSCPAWIARYVRRSPSHTFVACTRSFPKGRGGGQGRTDIDTPICSDTVPPRGNEIQYEFAFAIHESNNPFEQRPQTMGSAWLICVLISMSILTPRFAFGSYDRMACCCCPRIEKQYLRVGISLGDEVVHHIPWSENALRLKELRVLLQRRTQALQNLPTHTIRKNNYIHESDHPVCDITPDAPLRTMPWMLNEAQGVFVWVEYNVLEHRGADTRPRPGCWA